MLINYIGVLRKASDKHSCTELLKVLMTLLKPEMGELLKRLLLQNTKENVQSSLLQRTNRIFCWCRDFFLSVCLMDWNTLG